MSLLESPPALGKVIRDFVQERLDRWLPPAQAEEPDGPVRERDLGPHQPMRPVRTDVEGVAQERHVPLRVRAPQEDDDTMGRGLEVQLPGRGEWPAGRGRLQARGDVAAGGRDVPGRLGLLAGALGDDAKYGK